MLAFSLLAKRAMPICMVLHTGNPATMAFRQQTSQEYVGNSMGQNGKRDEPGKMP
jgi:hypothetical protein